MVHIDREQVPGLYDLSLCRAILELQGAGLTSVLIECAVFGNV